MRAIDCKWKPQWDSKEVVLVRLDSDEIIERRTMTKKELQLEFDETLHKWQAEGAAEDAQQAGEGASDDTQQAGEADATEVEEPPTGLSEPPMLPPPIDAEWDDDQPQASV